MQARPHRPVRRRRAALAAAVLVALAVIVSGCSSGSKGSAGPQTELSATPATAAPTPPSDAKVIAVTVNGSTVTPSGTKVQVKAGQPIVFQITADVAGELHVHATPAKAIQYPAGRSEVEITIDQPGLIEAEIEQLGKLVVELEVS